MPMPSQSPEGTLGSQGDLGQALELPHTNVCNDGKWHDCVIVGFQYNFVDVFKAEPTASTPKADRVHVSQLGSTANVELAVEQAKAKRRQHLAAMESKPNQPLSGPELAANIFVGGFQAINDYQSTEATIGMLGWAVQGLLKLIELL